MMDEEKEAVSDDAMESILIWDWQGHRPHLLSQLSQCY